MHTPQRILISPLDWGLGHATRCIPVIRLLLKKNAAVIIAGDGRSLELLKQEFPALEFIRLKGYSIHYQEDGSMVWKMFLSIPSILAGIAAENKALKRIIKEKNIHVVISDNRFGLWNKTIKSVFITHQVMIKTPFAEKLLHRINVFFIKKFDECWIPDTAAENNLSGDLSHQYPLPPNAFYIGALSRFAALPPNPFPKGVKAERAKHDVLAVISGPEPQRTIFEKIISEQLLQQDTKALVVCGKTEEQYTVLMKQNVQFVNHLNAAEMQEAICDSKIIIVRSGYSTVMDLAALGKKAIFIPTPGQTEQEYLAEMLMQKGIAYYQKQNEFNLEEALTESEKYKGFETNPESNELEKRINLL